MSISAIGVLPVEVRAMHTGQEVAIIGLRDEVHKTTVTGIEMFHRELDAAVAGDNAGILLRGVAPAVNLACPVESWWL